MQVLGMVCRRSVVSRQTQGQQAYLLGADGLLACLAELLNGLVVVTQILLATNEDDGKALAEMQDLRNPLQEASTSVSGSQGASPRNETVLDGGG